MKDADVRSAICRHLGNLHADDQNTLIVEEMGIWSGAVRIDIAVINGELHGFELKSAKDNLNRLPEQRRIYDLVFDRVTLVVADKHQVKALPLIPEWWAVMTAAMGSSGVGLQEYRTGTINPRIDPLQVARLLWRGEALSCLEQHGGSKGFKSATSEKLAIELSTRLDINVLRAEVRTCLKRRLNWLGQRFCDQRKVAVGIDLNPLRPTSRR